MPQTPVSNPNLPSDFHALETEQSILRVSPHAYEFLYGQFGDSQSFNFPLNIAPSITAQGSQNIQALKEEIEKS